MVTSTFELAIDLSSAPAGIALRMPDGSIQTEDFGQSRHHLETLIPGIKKLLDRNRLAISNLKTVWLTQGPGSFTGLRIAMATAKALAASAQCSIRTVDTAELRALSWIEANPNAHDFVITTRVSTDRWVCYGFHDTELKQEWVADSLDEIDGTQIDEIRQPSSPEALLRLGQQCKLGQTASGTLEMVPLTPTYFGERGFKKAKPAVV